MPQSSYTPILLYGSGTASAVPLSANLTSNASGVELALNYNDGKLFYKDSGGVVRVLASKATGSIGGSTTQIQYNSSGVLAGSSSLTFSGTTLAVTTSSGGDAITATDGTVSARIAGFASSTLNIGTTSAHSAYISTNGVQRFGVNSSGNVSINAPNSSTALTVTGQSGANIASFQAAAASDAGIIFGITSSQQWNLRTAYSDGSFRLYDQTRVAYPLIVSTAGNVTIGFPSSGAALTVTGLNAARTLSNACGSAVSSFDAGFGVGLAGGYWNLFTNGADPLAIGTGGASQFALYTNQVPRIYITSGGNVGVGTTSPATRLQSAIDATDVNVGQILASGTTDTNKRLSLGFHTTSNYGFIQALIAGTNTYDLVLQPNGSNLGLGVTPSAWASGAKALQIKSYSCLFESSAGKTILAFNARESAANVYSYLQTEYASCYQQVSGGHYWFNAASGTLGNAITFTQAMTLDTSGNLGIGVTPSAWGGSYKVIQFGGNSVIAGNDVVLASNTYNNGTNWVYSTNNYATRYEPNFGAGGVHAWFVAPSGTAGNAITFTEAMRITSTGNVTIAAPNSGTALSTSVASSATFQGAIFATNAINSDLLVRIKTSVSDLYNSAGSITFSTGGSGGTEALRITSGGNVGIGTTSPSQKLTVSVGDNNQALSLQATTGRIRFRPYVDATSGAIIESLNPAELSYLPLSFVGSQVRLTADTASGVVIIGTAASTAALRIDTSAAVGSQTATWPTINPTNKPGSGTGSLSKWIPINLDGTTYYIPAWS